VDLFAIACRGKNEAWVAGHAGTVLHTGDGGETWAVVPGARPVDLRAVAVAHDAGVYIAGDDGTLLFTNDEGKHWRTASAGTTNFTGVATTAVGDVALLTGADGTLWRYEAGTDRITPLLATTGPALRSVAMTADGRRAVAVGDQGTYLVSDDGGRSFQPRAVGTTRNLNDVWLLKTGDRAIAVGAAGVVVDVDGSAAAPHITELLPASAALRALHLSSDGTGLTAGDGGAAFVTDDAGHTWKRVDVQTTATLLGVDALHGEPHL
jgi:photosystem II stability/assembly factor-like uncharacterized protein